MADQKSMNTRVVGIRYIMIPHPYYTAFNGISVKRSRNEVAMYLIIPTISYFFDLPSDKRPTY
jgi:hypothetical protein